MVRRSILAVLMLLAVSFLAWGEIIHYERPRQLGRIANPDIKESSGLAISHENPDMLWTHNDAGDLPRLFAVNIANRLEGTHLAEYRVAIEGKAIDWEDMASYTTPRGSYLLIGDIGDNDLKRKSYIIHQVKEPKLKKSKPGEFETVKPQISLEFTYEDGSNNAEAMAIDVSDPRAPVIILITKSEGTCKAYELKLPERRSNEPPVAKLLTRMTIPMVTGMDISPDGRRAVVLTYSDAYEYTRKPDQTWAQALAGRPRVLEMPLRKQGETICYARDGKTIYITSEGTSSPIWRIDPRPED